MSITEFSQRYSRHYVVSSDSGCWLWTSGLSHNGYGRAYNGEKIVRAHRLSYEMAYGPIPAGMQVCHKCDQRNCVNPRHLFIGTQLTNMHDMIRKGRKVVSQGEAHVDTKLTDAEVVAIFHDQRDRSLIAQEYGIHIQYVHRLKRGASRKYLTRKLVDQTQRMDR